MQLIKNINEKIIWGIPMVVLLLFIGVFLSFITKGVIFRKFGTVLRLTVKALFKGEENKTGEGQISPFGAICTALAGTVGTGNIVGVALAISIGGPGAIFWLWVSALLGMVVKYCEVMLAVAFRTENKKGETVGGPMYYISRGLGSKGLAVLFAVCGFLASFGIGASVQSNSLTNAILQIFPTSKTGLGVAVMLLSALVLIGGIKRISRAAEFLVPFMAAAYILGATAVLLINVQALPEAFLSIFKSAFSGTAASGGFLGASAINACKAGISRGVFTHEAGMGSAPIAHAAVSTDHPARQGLLGAFEVFFDSIVMCTVTGLVILSSGVWRAHAQINEGGICSAAFSKTLAGGEYIVSVSLALFAFATVIAWYYYGEKCVEFLCDKPLVILGYKIVYIIFVFLGCVASLDTVWLFADLFNGLMAIPNLISLLLLSPIIKRLSADFFSRQK